MLQTRLSSVDVLRDLATIIMALDPTTTVAMLFRQAMAGALVSPGIGLGGVYLIGICVVLAAYLVRCWFAAVKERRVYACPGCGLRAGRPRKVKGWC